MLQTRSIELGASGGRVATTLRLPAGWYECAMRSKDVEVVRTHLLPFERMAHSY